MADRGGGVSRFLTSDPAEDDITTALDEVLAEWDAPVAAGLTLEVNRPTAEATGRTVKQIVPGPAAGIDLGDPATGRPVWVAARLPLAGNTLVAKLTTAGGEVVAESRAVAATVPGVKQLFGASRIRRLESLMTGGLTADAVRTALQEMGYDTPPPVGTVYAENAPDAAGLVKPILVREALAFGLPSAETAFVAVRQEPGQKVTQTVVVANAAPAGWNAGAVTRGGSMVFASAMLAAPPRPGRKYRSAPPPAKSSGLGNLFGLLKKSAPPPPESDDDLDDDFDALEYSDTMSAGLTPLAPTITRGGSARGWREPASVRLAIAAGAHHVGHGAVLLATSDGSVLPLNCRLTAITVEGLTTVPDDMTLLIFVGDPTTLRARVRLVDVLKAGGRRPLNIQRGGQEVRVVIDDPSGAWAAGVPAMMVGIAVE